MTNEQQNEVLEAIEGIAELIDLQCDTKSIEGYFDLANRHLESNDEKQAFYYGTIALLAKVGKLHKEYRKHVKEFEKAM